MVVVSAVSLKRFELGDNTAQRMPAMILRVLRRQRDRCPDFNFAIEELQDRRRLLTSRAQDRPTLVIKDLDGNEPLL